MTENTLAPVDLGTAQRIDSALRAQTRVVAGAMADWLPLIEEARDKGIHAVLGFKSWPAYVSDVIHSHMGALLPADRLQVVEVLSREGMSQRAIATAVGVSQKTVDRDLDQLSHDDSVDLPSKVISLDGKERPAHPVQPVQPKPLPEPEVPSEKQEYDLENALSAKDAAAYLQKRTAHRDSDYAGLRRLRGQNGGPAWFKVNGRVYYEIAELDQWVSLTSTPVGQWTEENRRYQESIIARRSGSGGAEMLPPKAAKAGKNPPAITERKQLSDFTLTRSEYESRAGDYRFVIEYEVDIDLYTVVPYVVADGSRALDIVEADTMAEAEEAAAKMLDELYTERGL